MKYYEVWEGDEYLGIFSYSELMFMLESDSTLRYICVNPD